MSQNKTQLVIIGASGFGREVLWTIRDCNNLESKYDVLGFIDDNSSLNGKKLDELSVIGDLDWLAQNLKKDVKCVIAIADCNIRKQIAQKILHLGFSFETIIHPSVKHSSFVEIGCGTIIQAGCILTVDVKIGKHVHINLNTTVGHDSIIEDFVTLNPGIHVNGNTTIQEGSFVGSGTVMKQGLTVGKWTIIGAGSVLIKDLPSKALYVGVLGKIKKIMD